MLARAITTLQKPFTPLTPLLDGLGWDKASLIRPSAEMPNIGYVNSQVKIVQLFIASGINSIFIHSRPTHQGQCSPAQA